MTNAPASTMSPWRPVVTRRSLAVIGLTAYVAVVVIGVSYAIGLIAQADLLIPLAAPLGIALVAAFAWLPGRVQLIAWAAATIWLLPSMYLGYGDLEYVAFVVIIVLVLLSLVRSPWFLVAIWLLHPIWDVAVQRDLPDHLHDLSIGCVIYDLVIGGYLAVQVALGRLGALGSGRGATSVPWPKALRNLGLAAAIAGVVFAQLAVVSVAADTDALALWAAPIALVVAIGLWFLPPVAQTLGWVVMTGWMGMTYAHGGEFVEIVVFFGIVLLAALGAVASPSWLVIAWGFHLLWNAVPREAHEHAAGMGHLGHDPLASAIYDAILLVVLVMAIRASKLALVPPVQVATPESQNAPSLAKTS